MKRACRHRYSTGRSKFGLTVRIDITHRRTAYHPEGNSYIERFHLSLKEEEVWPSEYRSGTYDMEPLSEPKDFRRDRLLELMVRSYWIELIHRRQTET